MNNNENTGNQEIRQRLKTAESLWALVSGCTKEPYVVCDPETFEIILATKDGVAQTYLLKELLPQGFQKSELG